MSTVYIIFKTNSELIFPINFNTQISVNFIRKVMSTSENGIICACADCDYSLIHTVYKFADMVSVEHLH